MAVLTEAQVCNLALAAVGQREILSSLEDRTEAARLCKAVYAPIRDDLLCRFPWTFATKRVELAQSTETRTDFEYAFVMPTNYMGAPAIIYDGARAASATPFPFRIEPNDAGDGLLLLTDVDEVELSYTVNNANVALFSPAFITALAAAIAVELALGLAIKPALAASLASRAEFRLAQAMAIDGNTGVRDAVPESEITTVR